MRNYRIALFASHYSGCKFTCPMPATYPINENDCPEIIVKNVDFDEALAHGRAAVAGIKALGVYRRVGILSIEALPYGQPMPEIAAPARRGEESQQQ